MCQTKSIAKRAIIPLQVILNESIQIMCDSCEDTWMDTATASFTFAGQTNLHDFSFVLDNQWTTRIPRACPASSLSRHANVSTVDCEMMLRALFVAENWIFNCTKWTNVVMFIIYLRKYLKISIRDSKGVIP